MSSRPSLTSRSSRRPLSAIFIGSVPNSQLPDLPDPPSSPNSSSGLPSPPATNSTGSGGAEGNTSSGSIRIPSTSESVTTMSNGGSNKDDNNDEHSGSRTPSDEADDINDEDHTARLDLHKPTRSSYADENASALQRVKSLTQRNRLVLDKLASISSGSRLSTPSPTTNVRRLSRSPAPSTAHSATSRASSSNLRRDRSESLSLLSRSGSETEREQFPTAESPSDDLLAETPPSTSTMPKQQPDSVRQRMASAPESPDRVIMQSTELSGDRSSASGGSATWGRREGLRSLSRASVDIEAAALAAVANTRRSPTSATARRRQPLPREFRDRSSLDGRRSVLEPRTPKKEHDRNGSPALRNGRASPSPSSHAATVNDTPQSPRRLYRYSTVRDVTRRHQARFLSEELSPPSRRSLDDSAARPQYRRAGGSNESPLNPGGRSVIGESLRAAGLSPRKKKDAEDVFRGESSLQAGRRQRLSGDLGGRAPLASTSESRPGTRLSNRPGTSDGLSLNDPRTPATSHQNPQRAAHSSFSPRPATSMALYHDEPRTAPLLRNYKSAYPIHEKERQTSLPPDTGRPPSRLFPNSAHDRQYSSPSALGRQTATPLSIVASNTTSTPEHTRLMLDSLNMFESQLARLPSMGSTTTVTIPELFRSAQNIVHSTNTLNGMLRTGTARALERQIDAEVEDGEAESSTAVWATVGSEYRESLRVSDELVRTMTSFLLGVGKLLKEATPERAQAHQRGGSLDESAGRRPSPDVSLTLAGKSSDGKRSTDGRNSMDLKRRWELPSSEEGGGKNTASSQSSQPQPHARAPTSLQSRSSNDLNELADRSDRERDRRDVSMDLNRRASTLTLTAARRTNTNSASGSESKGSHLHHAPSLSFTSSGSSSNLMQSDNSQSQSSSSSKVHFASTTTDFSRSGAPRRPLPPAPLPTLPSESLLNRSASVRATRRPKTASITSATVRAPANIFPSLTSSSSNPTTAVTTTPASPERPLRATQRTFSRSTAIALAGLQEQYERDGRKRTISAEGAEDDTHTSMVESNRRTLGSRTRMSLDGRGIDLNMTASDRRERRGTVAGLFSRS